MTTIQEVQAAMKAHYPNDYYDEVALRRFGSIQERSMIALGIVLVSSLVLETTDVSRLASFTTYSRRFIAAVARNMENSRLWKDGKYDCSAWSSGNFLPRNRYEEEIFWDHVCIAEGTAWMSEEAESHGAGDPCAIFCEDKASERSLLLTRS